VRLKSRDPLAAPAMEPNYLSAELDRRMAVAAIRFARRIAQAPALAAYIASEYRPGDSVASDDELLAFAREYGATIFHPSGTCKMGHDPLAVVDDRLRVHGLEGLRVADCSVMPTLVSGNTNAAVVMIAEKAADLFLEDDRAAA
jgi:choline dehydrogenase